MLHPKYKLSYFWLKNWPEEWVDAAHTVLREQWSSYYKPHNDSELDPSSQSSSSTLVCFLYCYDSKLSYLITRKQGPTHDDLFDELDNFGTNTTTDELEEYLNTPTISTKGLKPLTWWYATGEFNPLTCMAINFLSALGKPFISFW